MRPYVVYIRMDDGARAVMSGKFPTDWAAIDTAWDLFENATMVIPRRKECV